MQSWDANSLPAAELFGSLRRMRRRRCMLLLMQLVLEAGEGLA